jgi:hypothetical protein
MTLLRTIEFDQAADAYVIRNNQSTVCDVLHSLQPLVVEGATAVEAAADYLRNHAELLGLDPSELNNLTTPVSPTPGASVDYRFLSEKRQFDVTTVTFEKVVVGVPVYQDGLAVHLKGDGQVDAERGVAAFQVICAKTGGLKSHALANLAPAVAAAPPPADITPEALTQQLGFVQGGPKLESLRILHQAPMVYRYSAAKRFSVPHFELPPLSSDITDGSTYLVTAIYFEVKLEGLAAYACKALAESASGSILQAEGLSGGINGMVFLADPETTNGGPLPDGAAAQLDARRVVQPLLGLAPPQGAQQQLAGDHIKLVSMSGPPIPPPVKAPGSDFDFAVRSDDFSAVNAYYNCDRFFRFVEQLGFDRQDYFPGTDFPIPVDHRGATTHLPIGPGIEIAAQCNPKFTAGPHGVMIGIGSVIFCVAETRVTPLVGIANDWRVVLHELGGHGSLQNHVGSSFFVFAHSAGDSLAAILNAPDSKAADKGDTFPWIVSYDRRHDRSVQDGWAWDGPKDVDDDAEQLQREQILSTTHFRLYNSLGGGSDDVGQRQTAAKQVAYLILRAIKTLTPATNPQHASDWLCSLIVADSEDWKTEGLSGGAYAKVIYWAFEKQNLFSGQAPDVDVYIDDGRGGEYAFQPNYSSCPSIWNRLAADGGTDHQAPVPNAVNFAYVKISNRGRTTATQVAVEAFRNSAGSGLIYPDDWKPMDTATLAAADLAPGNEVTVGPFEWTPADQDNAILMAVSASGDLSNLSKFTAGRSIAMERLVPHDNNLGMRKLTPIIVS